MPHTIRKPLVFIVGTLVVIAGIIMLVIPGPGWGAIFLGFAILATEFQSAARIRNWLVHWLKVIIAWLQRVWDRMRGKPKTTRHT